MKHIYYGILLLLFTGIKPALAQAPRVSSFSPASGPVGTTVTIYGSGFGAAVTDNAVYFGATQATVNTANTSKLFVTVPSGATNMPITVINKATKLIGYSPLAFITSFPQAGTDVSLQVKLPFDATVSDVRIADIDGDGKTDILATNPVQGTMMVFRNEVKKGRLDTGSFAAPVVYKTGSQSGFVSIDDFDGDGYMDVVLMNIGFADNLNGNNSLSLFLNKSTPGHINLSAVAVTDSTAETPASYTLRLKPGDYIARISDFDGDGKPDIGVLNTGGFISIYRNNNIEGVSLKKMFSAPVTISGHDPNSFIIGDIDSDGKPDIITSSRDSSSLTILRNNSVAGAITKLSFKHTDFLLDYRPVTVSLVDADMDGKFDIAVSMPNNKFVLLHNTSTAGRISVTSRVFSNLKVLSNYSDNILIRDADGDGEPDLLSLDAKLKTVQLYTNKIKTGQKQQVYFNEEMESPLITLPDCIGDLDGDGRPDMIIGNYFGIDIYYNRPSFLQKPLVSPPIITVDQDYLNVYPNPASAYTNVKYNLPIKSDVLISVYDNFGNLLSSLKTGEQAAGDHVNTIGTANLRMGVYVVTVNAKSYNKVAKLLIK